MVTTPPPAMRELHCRTADGIHVRLLWSEHGEVGEHDRPLAVFHHPYAYASVGAACE